MNGDRIVWKGKGVMHQPIVFFVVYVKNVERKSQRLAGGECGEDILINLFFSLLS